MIATLFFYEEIVTTSIRYLVFTHTHTYVRIMHTCMYVYYFSSFIDSDKFHFVHDWWSLKILIQLPMTANSSIQPTKFNLVETQKVWNLWNYTSSDHLFTHEDSLWFEEMGQSETSMMLAVSLKTVIYDNILHD